MEAIERIILIILLIANVILFINNWIESRKLRAAGRELLEFSEQVSVAVNSQGAAVEQIASQVTNLTVEGELVKTYLQAHDNILQLHSNFEKSFGSLTLSKLENLGNQND